MTRTIDRDVVSGDELIGLPLPRSKKSVPGDVAAVIRQSRELIEESKRIMAESRKLDPLKG